ncbi:alpha/beta hydrolase [Devosia sp. 1566]|uniref:alpha/beta hydrolase n=1 Tax=Devosia sp. 1566 TaxID=2499144 RepID=UPI0013E37729|nr:alpha/beta hydrolase [Devosia sp. 1566]
MTIVVDPNGPKLASDPNNPVPEGGRVGFFRSADGVRLRYAIWPKGVGPHRGTVCLLQGRTEFIEKYFETIADFRSRGFGVATFDWRGQGGSERLIGNPKLGYVDKFSDYWSDLKSFHSEILLPDCPPPYYLVAHSMGGLAALFAGVNDRLMFERIFLSSPMVGLESPPFGTAGAARILSAMSFLGLGRLPLRRPQDKAASKMAFADNPLTGDPERFARSIAVLKAHPELEIGAPTIQWTGAALAAMAAAQRDDFPEKLRVPLLILAAARDRVVWTPATEELGLRLRTGRHMVVPGAQHELFMETDAIRAQVFAAFDAFITEQS